MIDLFLWVGKILKTEILFFDPSVPRTQHRVGVQKRLIKALSMTNYL